MHAWSRTAHGAAGAVVGLRGVMIAVVMPRAVSRSLLSRRVVLSSRSRSLCWLSWSQSSHRVVLRPWWLSSRRVTGPQKRELVEEKKKRTYEQTVACEVKSSPSPPSYTMRTKQPRPTTLRSCACNPHSMPTTLRRPTLRDTKQMAGPCCVLSERVTSRRGTRAMAEPSVLRERHIALEVIRVGPGGP